MAKKSATSKTGEPEAANQMEPAGTTISKSEAARQAIAAGLDSPEEATNFIRKQFGIEMSKAHFSAVKSQVKAKAAEGTPAPKGKPGRKPKAASGDVTLPTKPRAAGETALIESLETLKPLIAHYGATKVKRLVDLLG
jgi:hypothetical protein